jgi:hypothetical protein
MVAMGLRDVSPPCVVFFRRSKGGFTDVSAVPLDHTNLIHGFHELYEVIAKYNDRKLTPAPILKYLRWVPGAIKFISLETLRAALKLGLEVLLS